MIAYIEGKIKILSEDRITLVVNGIGYEVLLPAYLSSEIKAGIDNEEILGFYVSYNQTERQPKPILVGFLNALDKEFFELFISVEDIGPAAAIKALIRPVRDIARYIEEKDIKSLKQLKGIGERKAQKIVATLKGKVAKYALIKDTGSGKEICEDFVKEVESVLIKQLGYKSPDAKKMIAEALERNPGITSSEGLFDEVYKGQKR